jgi:hypothetical protein
VLPISVEQGSGGGNERNSYAFGHLGGLHVTRARRTELRLASTTFAASPYPPPGHQICSERILVWLIAVLWLKRPEIGRR